MPQPDSGDNCCDCPSRTSPCDDCGTGPTVNISLDWRFDTFEGSTYGCSTCAEFTINFGNLGILTTNSTEVHTSFDFDISGGLTLCVGPEPDCDNSTTASLHIVLDYSIDGMGNYTFSLAATASSPECINMTRTITGSGAYVPSGHDVFTDTYNADPTCNPPADLTGEITAKFDFT